MRNPNRIVCLRTKQRQTLIRGVNALFDAGKLTRKQLNNMLFLLRAAD